MFGAGKSHAVVAKGGEEIAEYGIGKKKKRGERKRDKKKKGD